MKYLKYGFVFIVSIVFIYIVIEKIARLKYIRPKWKKIPPINKEKGKVILYTSYNKSYKDQNFVKLNADILTRYCKINGHEYRKIIHEDDFMSPYWTRVYDLKNLCYSTPDGTLIMYLDADAIPLYSNKKIKVNQFIENMDYIHGNVDKDIYISEDPNRVYPLIYNGVFNTGCFIVRNTEKSRKFIDSWMDKYNKEFKWGLNDSGKWECKIKGYECKWSQDGYEQGEFSKLYDDKGKDIIQYLHWSSLACMDPNNKNCFVLHLMASSSSTREKIFTEQLEKYLC